MLDPDAYFKYYEKCNEIQQKLGLNKESTNIRKNCACLTMEILDGKEQTISNDTEASKATNLCNEITKLANEYAYDTRSVYHKDLYNFYKTYCANHSLRIDQQAVNFCEIMQ